MGRNKVAEAEKKKQRQVYLTDAEKAAILKKHETLTAAIQTTIPKIKK